mgnify:CR=1 FL=1
MNINNPTTFSTPDLTLSTSNSSGVAGALRADDTILVYDSTVPTTIASGASAATGSAATSARRDHSHGAYTATAAATQAEEEAASTTTAYTSPGRQQYHPGVAKAWLQSVYSGGTPTITGSYNVASLTDLGVGVYKLVYSTDMSGTDNVAAVCVCRTDNDSSDVATASSPATTGINIALRRGGTKTDLPSMVAVFGDQ